MFLLNYIHDLELRKMIQSATNKSEEFNQFTKWLFFGNDSIIAEDVAHEQHKIIQYNQLVSNLAILHTVNGMTRAIGELRSEGYEFSDDVLAHFGPYRTNHLNRLGNYILNIGKIIQPMEYGDDFL